MKKMLSKRDVKKSYYVWFLGAQEARVARGIRPALAALHRLERRSHDLDPFKVTLQVSPKGLKIVQNVDGRAKGGRGGRSHTVKHFLPADSVTEVVARGDAVVCVLLLYNPVTRCPLHAHAYRCDSEQTAQALCAQLRSVAGLGPEEEEEENPSPSEESPDHIEPNSHPVEARLAPEQEVAAEKLAAELRKRLAGREPLLLPPRDYDTDRRNGATTVPGPAAGRRLPKGVLGSSAGSSGIGSDLAPSPDRPHTSSEEDWTEGTAYMLHESYEGLPRRARSPSPVKQSNRKAPSADRPIARNDRSNGQNNHSGSVSPKDRFNVAKEKFMNLEREKISEEIDKRAQMRRNLNSILSRGPKTPLEVQARQNPKWPSEEDLRQEMPRAVMRDQRNFRDSRDDVREHRVSSREYRDYREVKEPLDMRELKEVKPLRDSRDYRDYREDSRGRYPREDERRNYDERKYQREYKEPKDAKYLRDYREVEDIRDIRLVDEGREVRPSRERTPQLEQRYYEYKGERNDKYFDSRYKHDSRSDDEGVESEKQFDEMRYVPHVELPRRREPETRMNKIEPKKDGRAELLEERQRQMEAKRVVKNDIIDDRYEREPQRRQVDNRDWEVLRRSYAEAERPRRDARTRHSYAEPVARTRVGMATVAPF